MKHVPPGGPWDKRAAPLRHPRAQEAKGCSIPFRASSPVQVPPTVDPGRGCALRELRLPEHACPPPSGTPRRMQPDASPRAPGPCSRRSRRPPGGRRGAEGAPQGPGLSTGGERGQEFSPRPSRPPDFERGHKASSQQRPADGTLDLFTSKTSSSRMRFRRLAEPDSASFPNGRGRVVSVVGCTRSRCPRAGPGRPAGRERGPRVETGWEDTSSHPRLLAGTGHRASVPRVPHVREETRLNSHSSTGATSSATCLSLRGAKILLTCFLAHTRNDSSSLPNSTKQRL